MTLLSTIGRWLIALLTLLLGSLLRTAERAQRKAEREQRIVAPGEPAPRAELVVVALLLLAGLFAIGFVVVYAEFSPATISNELLGCCLALALLSVAGALTVFARRIVPDEELEHEYPPRGHPDEQLEAARIVRQSGQPITRKKLLAGAGAVAGGALGLAALAPALSLGPLLDTDPLYRTPWRRGLQLVDESGAPLPAADIEQGSFYTAFPQGADPEQIGAPVVVVRLSESALRLPADRAGWAPRGIVAFSKVCTHAGCAIALYRKPTFAALEPRPALVCPCHYSTFDPATGGTVIYGPAGRPLPQLPLMIDRVGRLRSAGNFSGPVGPSWWGVRTRRPSA